MDSDTFTMKVYRAKFAEMQSLIVSHKIVHHLNYTSCPSTARTCFQVEL